MLADKYPTLRLVGDVLPAMIVGSLPIEHEREIIGRFMVEIDLPERYPDQRPVVREVGGAIPHDLSHHNPGGKACIFHPAAYWLDGFDKKPLTAYLDGPVRNFFLFQCCVAAGVAWPHGEQAHGTAGALDFIGERLGVGAEAAKSIVRALATTRATLTRHSLCPCGSRRSIRRCHPRVLAIAHRVPKSILRGIDAGSAETEDMGQVRVVRSGDGARDAADQTSLSAPSVSPRATGV